ncbi:MAG: hypothetical protein JNN01_12065 [Opitutaceae bacterium]|nr:hypothetical protein [Opitutaceae bacterium]
MNLRAVGVLVLVFQTIFATEPDPRPLVRLTPFADSVASPLFLNGILVIGNSATASIAIRDKTQSNWYLPKAVVGNFIIEAITKDSVQLRQREPGKIQTLQLQGSTLASAQPGKPALYSKAWINSTENPMLHYRQPLPTELVTSWTTLTPQERDEVARYYRNHGWRLVGAEVDDSGITHFAWENLYSDERSQVMIDSRRTFIESLNPEQRSMWDESKSRSRIVAAKEGFTDEEKQEIARRRQHHQRFLATLSAQQRVAYDGMTDFTQHNWNG